MNKINIITQPDKLFNSNCSILLIYPSNAIKEQMQNFLAAVDLPFNIYYYEVDENEHNPDWLLSVNKICDFTILDVDNCPPIIRDMASYFISQNNTYWLTKAENVFYNKVSINRVYNLDFLNNITGETIET
jgi:hypothetical protein